MDVYTAIRTRRDVERFAPDLPSRDVIERLLEAAVWAPNHRLTEPWRFAVLAGTGRDAMADALEGWLAAQGAPEGAARAARAKLLRAPVVLIVAQVASPEDPERDLEDYAACYCAIENLLLAATAEGLVGHLSTGAMTTYEGAKTYLGLRPTDRIVAYVNLGYPAPDAPPKEPRRSPPQVRWDWVS